MAYWLFKSEPNTWGWDDQVKRGAKGEHWDGVRNYQANNNMKAMKIGDLGFFYHSVDEKSVVGIVRVIKEHYPDHTDPKERFGMVDIEAVEPLPKPVTLQGVKDTPELKDMVLVNNSRLSVQPVTADEWKRVCKMGGLKKVPTAKKIVRHVNSPSKSFGDAQRREKWLAKVPPAGTPLCALEDIDVPGAKGFTFGEGRARFDMFVVRTSTECLAYVNACPHAFTPLETFTDKFLTRKKDQILCTTHGALFNLDDGFCTSGPCAGKSLVPIPIEIDDGKITIAPA